MMLAMSQERIEYKKEEQIESNVLGNKKIRITRHAGKQFYSRTGFDLEGNSRFLKERLQNAKIVEIYSKKIKHPFIKDKNHHLTLYQDSLDPKLFYLVKRKKKTDVLITVFSQT